MAACEKAVYRGRWFAIVINLDFYLFSQTNKLVPEVYQ